MFGKIAAFEFRYQLKNPVFWIAVGVFFLLTFGAVTVENISIGGGGGQHRNSPFQIGVTHLILTLFYMFVSTAFVANVVVRDDETGFGGILRSTSISRFDYLYGRFAGAVAAAALAYLAVPLAIFVGSFMPWIDPENLGPLTVQPFLVAYFGLALPNILLTSALFFTLATVTRSLMWTYIGVIAFLVLYSIANIALGRPEYEGVAALLEPLGLTAYFVAAKYWTTAERNLMIPAIEGVLLYNRLIALGITAVVLALPMLLFRFQAGELSGKRARKARMMAAAAPSAGPPPVLTALPRPRFDVAAAMAQLRVRTRLDMGQVFGSPAYLVLMALGLFNALGSLWFATEADRYGGVVWPVTRIMVPPLIGSFALIPMIIAIYYAGELVWREREKKTHEIVDAAPVPDWAFVIPKTLAISLVLVSTVVISAIAAILIQLVKGYTDVQLVNWLVWYVLPQSADMVILVALAVFIQTLSPHKFIGWGLMVLYLISGFVLAPNGLDHMLYNYGAGPSDGGLGPPLSDLNGLGKFWIGAWWGRLYWGFCALVLLVLSHGLWRRGTETRLWPRLARLPHRMASPAGLLLALGLVGFAGAGTWIYINTNVFNVYRNNLDEQAWQADFEKELIIERGFDKIPQPKIIHVELNVEIQPHLPALRTIGKYVVQNTTSEPMKEIHLLFDRDLKVEAVSIAGGRPLAPIEKFNYRIFALDKPLQPGKSLVMSFTTLRAQKGFKNSGNESRVVDNGTFVNSSEIAPNLGVWRPGPLTDRTKRKEHGLKADQPMAPAGDIATRQFNYLRHDADFISSDITVTTVADQIPIAPGRRVSDTTANGKRTARFVSEAPEMAFLSVQSAAYAVTRERWKGLDLELYYAPAHNWNTARMMTAMKASIDYYQSEFGPYQFSYVRYIEFPGYASFAQAYPGTMPWSENMFFIADYRDPDKIDMITYVGAHEIGHQWWAYQVVGADQQGVTLLSETLAQYSALRVMKRMYGEDQIRKFLRFELNSYLRARGGEALEERPMISMEPSQQYIHYRKGSLVMYRLAEEIGEDHVNRALRKLIAQHGLKGPPYPTSWTLYELLKEETPREKWPLLDDLLLRITLYDLKTTDAKVVARKDGRFDVTLTIEAKKLEADGEGKETARPMREMVDIGVFTDQPGKKSFKKDDVLVLERREIHSGKQTVTFTVAKRPTWVGADPYNILIDRNSDDNLFKVGS